METSSIFGADDFKEHIHELLRKRGVQNNLKEIDLQTYNFNFSFFSLIFPFVKRLGNLSLKCSKNLFLRYFKFVIALRLRYELKFCARPEVTGSSAKNATKIFQSTKKSRLVLYASFYSVEIWT